MKKIRIKKHKKERKDEKKKEKTIHTWALRPILSSDAGEHTH
jgi:hypothetical protein